MKKEKLLWIFGGWTVEREDRIYDKVYYPFTVHSDVDGLSVTEKELEDTISTLQKLLDDYRNEKE